MIRLQVILPVVEGTWHMLTTALIIQTMLNNPNVHRTEAFVQKVEGKLVQSVYFYFVPGYSPEAEQNYLENVGEVIRQRFDENA